MPVKRSRIGSSSSHQAMQIETTAAAAVNPAMVTNADAAGEPSRLSMWTIGYPVSAGEYDQPRIGEFLERCYYCRKRIAENADVFMYSNLCAFCSTECRNLQIALDHSAKVAPDNPKGTMTHRQ